MRCGAMLTHAETEGRGRPGGLSNRVPEHINSAKEYSRRRSVPPGEEPMIIEGPDQVTEAVLSEIARAPNPRFREVMTALVKHLHAFIREAKLTEEEFHQACAIRQRHRPELQRVPQRGGAGVGLARRLDAGVPAQQRQQRRDRDHREPARSVLAARFAAHRERRLDRALADAGAGAVLQHPGQRPRRQAGRRRRGRRLAVLDRRASTRTRTRPRPT